jgi:hypothetical protein
MAGGSALDQESKATERIAGDRRCDRRYSVLLDLRWKLVHRRRVVDAGAGNTLDLSRSGVRIESGRPLPEGMNVELAISWPVLLRGVAPPATGGARPGCAVAGRPNRHRDCSARVPDRGSARQPWRCAIQSGPSANAFPGDRQPGGQPRKDQPGAKMEILAKMEIPVMIRAARGAIREPKGAT